MPEGKVKWFDKKKGYGFISCDTGPDVFVHHSCFSCNKIRTLNDGDSVIFEVTPGEKGPRALNVELKAESV